MMVDEEEKIRLCNKWYERAMHHSQLGEKQKKRVALWTLNPW